MERLLNMEKSVYVRSPISPSYFYKRFIKDKEKNDWLITRLGVCLILGIAENRFHAVVRKSLDFPKPIKKIRRRFYWSMRAIVEYNNRKGSKR